MSKNRIQNRYEVISHIGHGGMADVFLAVDTILNRQVAIKILRTELNSDTTAIVRFEREAQAASALAHPNIVEIYDVGEYKNHHFIVMEYVPGKTLKQVIKERGGLLIEEAVDTMKQLTSALASAHQKGIIHRDIKPQNMIVMADGSVKILDFGIAMAKGSMQLTQANNVMGSVHYLAPELAKGQTATAQSDIYALGVVFYEMLSGQVPFTADQAIQVALQHMKQPFPSIKEIHPEVPQSIENMIYKATAKDLNVRYQSCDELYQDLLACLRPERQNEPRRLYQTTLTHPSKTTVQANAQPVKKKLKKGIVFKIMLIFTILIVIGGVFLGVGYYHQMTHIPVPDLTGMTVDQAKKAIEDAHLKLDGINVQYTLTQDVEKGKIVSSQPEPATIVTKDTVVQITVSSGIGEVAKDYTGLNLNDVMKTLTKFPLLKVNAIAKESTINPGTIISQQLLLPGTLFDPNSPNQIEFTYSAYPKITIPEHIIGMTINEARQELQDMGIVVMISNRDTSALSQEEINQLKVGIVIDVNPKVNSEYTQKENNYVTLYAY